MYFFDIFDIACPSALNVVEVSVSVCEIGSEKCVYKCVK